MVFLKKRPICLIFFSEDDEYDYDEYEGIPFLHTQFF